MSTLNKINFDDLARYLWKAANFGTMQDSLSDQMKELVIGNRTSGVIYGCNVTVNANLTVNITAGLVLFSTGQLVPVAAQTLTFNTADATNPRLDRVEIAYTLEDGPTVTNIDNQSKILYKTHTATAQKNTGTPAGSPSANVLTVGRLSLAVVRVNAGATSLISGNISKTEDSERTISYLTFGQGQTAKIRFNESSSRFELTEDGTIWMPISRRTYDDISFAIANNQIAAANVTGMSFDSASYISIRASVLISLQSDTPTEFVESGILIMVWKPKTVTWDIRFEPTSFDDSGVVFSVSTVGTVGQLKYTSPNIAGANYVGKMRISNITVQAV